MNSARGKHLLAMMACGNDNVEVLACSGWLLVVTLQFTHASCMHTERIAHARRQSTPSSLLPPEVKI
jgi:hypothetical protein